MEVAIVDDEKVIREQIKKLAVKYEPDCNVKYYETGEELLAEGKKFDVLFLDIQMEGMNGIDTARALREKQEDMVVIFITGVKEYVFEAFDVSAFHYLLKPVEEKKFSEVFERAKKEVEKRTTQGQKNIFIKTRNRSFTINHDNILYIENRGKKVEIHTSNEIIDTYASMNDLEKQLGGNFYRCHRGYLVNIQRTELYFLLVPGTVGLLVCLLLRTIMITIENDMPKLLCDRYPILSIIVPAILILSLLSILYVVKTFQNMIVLNREKNSRIILEKQIGSMQEHMEEMEHIYSGTRSMKHDMKNTLSVIMQLATGNEETENAELQAYLSELNRTMERLEFQFRTGNTVVDTLLNMKYHEAVRTIPDMQMDADRLLFPDNLLIQSYDIGIILGNALACRKLKGKESDAETFIRLSSFRKGKMIFIEITNSFDGNVIRKRQSEFPATDKADKEAHGIGLANIKSVAEKYHGGVDWSVDGKVFILSVMMKDERRTENEY